MSDLCIFTIFISDDFLCWYLLYMALGLYMYAEGFSYRRYRMTLMMRALFIDEFVAAEALL